MVPAPSALRIAFFGIQAATSRKRPVVVGRRLRRRRSAAGSCAAFSAAFLAIACRHGVSFGWNHWRLASALLSCADDGLAVADQRHFRRLVVADLLGRDVELDDLDVLRIARRLAEMEDPVEPRAHQEDDVGLLQRQRARRRDRQRMVVRHHALAHRRAQERQLRALDEGADFVLGARPRHALAEENERPLGPFEQVQRRLDVLRRRHHARRFGHALDLRRLCRGRICPVMMSSGMSR